MSQEGDIRKFLHTILENRKFVTEPRTLDRKNQNGPLDTPLPREKTLKSGKSGMIPAKNGLSDETESNNGKDTLCTTEQDTLVTCLCHCVSVKIFS